METVHAPQHSKLFSARYAFLSKLRDSDILSHVDTIQYFERLDDSVGNHRTGESAIELSIKFTVYEEVALFASQVRELERGNGYYKLLNSKFVVPLTVTITLFVYGETAEVVSFYCATPDGSNPSLARLLNLHFKSTHNGTNHVSNVFSQYDNIIQNAFKIIISNVEKVHEYTLYGNILDELLLPRNSSLCTIHITHDDNTHVVSLQKDGVRNELKLVTNSGISHQLRRLHIN